jgi:hypothetical protein
VAARAAELDLELPTFWLVAEELKLVSYCLSCPHKFPWPQSLALSDRFCSLSLARATVLESLAALKAARRESSGEITTLDQLAAAVGTPDEEPSLEEVFSDSRKWRTGKFSIRRELR